MHILIGGCAQERRIKDFLFDFGVDPKRSADLRG